MNAATPASNSTTHPQPHNAPPSSSGTTSSISTATVSNTRRVAKGIFAGALGVIGGGVALTLAFVALPHVFMIMLASSAFLCLLASAVLIRSMRGEYNQVVQTKITKTENSPNLIRMFKAPGEDNPYEKRYISNIEVEVYKPGVLTADYFRSAKDFVFMDQSFYEQYKTQLEEIAQARKVNDTDRAEELKKKLEDTMLPAFLENIRRQLGPNRQHLIKAITTIFCQNAPLYIKNHIDTEVSNLLAAESVDRAIASNLLPAEQRALALSNAQNSITMVKTSNNQTPKSTITLNIPQDPTADVTIVACQTKCISEFTTIEQREPTKLRRPFLCQGTTTFTIGAQNRPDQVSSQIVIRRYKE